MIWAFYSGDKDLVCATLLARGDGLQKSSIQNTWSKFDNLVKHRQVKIAVHASTHSARTNMHVHEESKTETLAASCPAPFPLPHYVYSILSFATLKIFI
jgi:uncharacterized protein Smg (DUF494 family)